MTQAGAADNLRITLYAVGFVLLLASGIGFLVFGGRAEDPAVRFLHGAVNDFNDVEIEAFAGRFEFPLPVTIDGETDVYTREQLVREITFLHNRLNSIRILPEEAFVHEATSAGETEVDYHFHWVATSSMFAPVRRTSAGRDGDGPPALATVRMKQEGGRWVIVQVHMETRQWRPGY